MINPWDGSPRAAGNDGPPRALDAIVQDLLSVGIASAIICAVSLPFSLWAIVHLWGWLALLPVGLACLSVGLGIWAARRF